MSIEEKKIKLEEALFEKYKADIMVSNSNTKKMVVVYVEMLEITDNHEIYLSYYEILEKSIEELVDIIDLLINQQLIVRIYKN